MAQKKIRDLAAVPEILGEHYLVIETPEGTKQAVFSDFAKVYSRQILQKAKQNSRKSGRMTRFPLSLGS